MCSRKIVVCTEICVISSEQPQAASRETCGLSADSKEPADTSTAVAAATSARDDKALEGRFLPCDSLNRFNVHETVTLFFEIVLHFLHHAEMARSSRCDRGARAPTCRAGCRAECRQRADIGESHPTSYNLDCKSNFDCKREKE